MFIFIYLNANSQKTLTKIKAISSNNEGSNWYIIKNSELLNENNINEAETLKFLNLSSNNRFIKKKFVVDKLNIEHTTFQQTIYSYPIAFSELTFHKKNNALELTGFYVQNTNDLNIEINLNKLDVLNIVKKHYLEKGFTIDSNCIAKIIFKDKEKIEFISTSADLTSENINDYALCYVFNLYFLNKPSLTVYCSVVDGRIIFENAIETNCHSYQTGTNFYGVKNIYVSTKGNKNYFIDSCNYGNKILVSDNKWDAVNSKIQNDSTYSVDTTLKWYNMDKRTESISTSLFGVRKSLEYYFQVHNLTGGYDGNNSPIYILQNAAFGSGGGEYYSNASFDHNLHLLKIGNDKGKGPNFNDSISTDDWNTLDIMAHELTHGITASTVNLVYKGESGALNESFSDIFGATIYNYAFNYLFQDTLTYKYSWLVGKGRINKNILRNMSDPHKTYHPSTYLTDYNWVDIKAPYDNGGIHTNSQVQNYMYYILCSGNKGKNSNNLYYEIQPIGMAKARDIAYRTLTTPGYLTANSNFIQSRNAWVHSAVDLFGACSIEAITVGKAWEAVGVSPFNSQLLCGVHGYNAPENYDNLDTVIIGGNACVTGFTNQSSNVKDIKINSALSDIKDGSVITSTSTSLFFIKPDPCQYANY